MLFKEHILYPYNPTWRRSAILTIDVTGTSFFPAEGGPTWIKFRWLVQNDMSTAWYGQDRKQMSNCNMANVCANSWPDILESHLPHCMVLSRGEFTVMIPQPHARLQGAATWRNQWHHPRATCHVAWYAYCQLVNSLSYDVKATCRIAACKNSIRHIEHCFSPYFIFRFSYISLGFDERRVSYRLR